MKTSKEMSKIFKALSNPNRLELFLKIREQQELSIENGEKEHTCFLSGLVCNLNIGAPTISHHLKELVNAGLVETEKKGKFIACRLNAEVMDQAKKVFENLGIGKNTEEANA